MANLVNKGAHPARGLSGIGTVAVPSRSTGGNQTYRVPVKPLGVRTVWQSQNPNVLPLTVQRQSFVHPLKKQTYS